MPLLSDMIGLHDNDLNWHQMFFRALIVFVCAVIFIRIAGMRSFGTKSAFDVVLSITIGAVLSRSITGHYPFFATLGTALFLAILHRITAWLSFRFKMINKLTEGDSIQLYNDGKINFENLARHSIPEKDLLQAIRKENIDSFETVKSIWLEVDGKLSVIKKND
jgi:uncharacterized membrane protein YcaP (DUF421 family)